MDNELVLEGTTELGEYDWEVTCAEFGRLLEHVHPRGVWLVQVAGFGWRSQTGQGMVALSSAGDGEEMLRSILPETACRFRIFQKQAIAGNQTYIRLQNFHHDSPTGNEWYTLWPATIEHQCEYCGELSWDPHTINSEGVPVCPDCLQSFP